MSHRFRGVVVLLLCPLFFLACGPTGPTRLKMRFDISNRANADHPIKVDIVVAYDPALVDDLTKLTSAEWFSQRDTFQRDNPGNVKFHSWQYEITPGLDMPDVERPLPGRAAQGVFFADYLSRGTHTARFDPGRGQQVYFNYDSFRMVEGKATAPASAGWRPPVGWSMVALGTIGAGLGTYFLLQAASAADSTKGLTQGDRDVHQQFSDDIESNETGMVISYAVGATLLVAGAAILLWPESNDSPFREIPTSDDDSASAGIQW